MRHPPDTPSLPHDGTGYDHTDYVSAPVKIPLGSTARKCPTCSALPGEPCVMWDGSVVEWTHARRDGRANYLSSYHIPQPDSLRHDHDDMGIDDFAWDAWHNDDPVREIEEK